MLTNSIPLEHKTHTILIADDEADIRELLRYNLVAEGFEVFQAKNGDEALELARKNKPDLILLDIMMPQKSGVEVCNMLRAQTEFRETLIVMLTALNDDGSVIKGLEAGADDYIGKPVSPKVLVSRIKALLRRYPKEETKKLSIGPIQIEPEKYLVTVNGTTIDLAKKEFELVLLLARKPGRVYLRSEILSRVWGEDVIVGDRTIDVHIRKIRQKLGVECITTIKGVGYKFSL